jgi:hypothetical protein
MIMVWLASKEQWIELNENCGGFGQILSGSQVAHAVLYKLAERNGQDSIHNLECLNAVIASRSKSSQ